MAEREIDTDKLLENCYELKKYITALDTLLSDYVGKMQKVPTVTKEWQGIASQQFMDIIKEDYIKDYAPLLNTLRKYAAEIEIEAKGYKTISTDNKINDEDILR